VNTGRFTGKRNQEETILQTNLLAAREVARQLRLRDVGGIIGRGGTILLTARSQRFRTPEGRRRAIRNLYQRGVDALVVIGGNGSLTGAAILSEDFPVIGIPGSIDNDVYGTEMAIGVDTALNTILDAVDKIRDTASSHQRAFLIETMGRESGYLALAAGLSGGAEAILIPEVETPMEEVKDAMARAYDRGKAHFLAVVAEGWKPGTQALAKYLKEHQQEVGFRIRVTVLGYVQRGGDPTAFDRLLATRMGAAAVEWTLEGKSGFMVGLQGSALVPVPLKRTTMVIFEANGSPLSDPRGSHCSWLPGSFRRRMCGQGSR
jgi:6-phosphofructokinase 1